MDSTSDRTFACYLEQYVNHGYTLVSIILGYDLGLFDHFKNTEKPLTSDELASIAGCKERYIREWLYAISAAKIIEVQRQNDIERYFMPKDHYDSIVSTATYGKGIFFSYGRLDITKTYFEKDGPKGDADMFNSEPWDFFDEYRQKTASVTMNRYVFPNLESLKSLKDLLETGCNVLDVGCGTGDYTLLFADKYRNAKFVGLDQSLRSLQKARKKVEINRNINNVWFKQGSVENLDVDICYDIIICTEFLHNLPDPIEALRHINKALKEFGKLILMEGTLSQQSAESTPNMQAAYLSSASLSICLPFSMSGKSAIGYGATWKETEKLQAVGKYADLNAKFDLPYSTGLYVFTKKKKKSNE